MNVGREPTPGDAPDAPDAPDANLEAIYETLRRRARRLIRPGEVLDSGTIVHEAIGRVLEGMGALPADKIHLMATLCRAMRWVVLDHHRRQQAASDRGGSSTALDVAVAGVQKSSGDIEALMDALAELERCNRSQARLVDLHYFGGLSLEDIARELDLSLRTVERQWHFARRWLRQRIESRTLG